MGACGRGTSGLCNLILSETWGKMVIDLVLRYSRKMLLSQNTRQFRADE